MTNTTQTEACPCDECNTSHCAPTAACEFSCCNTHEPVEAGPYEPEPVELYREVH